MASMKKQWRVIDIVIASILGIAVGLIFWVWNGIGGAWYAAANAVTPGLGGIAAGVWLLGGVLGGLVIRKPFAALYVEVLAASVSAGFGNQWGIETVYSGIAQGLGAELIFFLFAYRRFGLPIAVLSGAGAGVGAFVLEFFLSANYAKSAMFNVTYLSMLIISGAVLAGVLGYCLVKALAATGVLDRFGAGREARKLV